MTLTLTLTPDKEARLSEQARQAGLPLDEYAVRVLDEAAAKEQATPPPARTLAEMLAGHIGTVEGPADLSEDTGRKFAALMQAKQEAGRL